jgi:4-hydroxy-tetrahydrodipicolinate synthase
MATYTKSEARDWAREHLVGVANVVIPTVTNDFKRLNERAIRHDIDMCVAHGFAGTLAVSEVVLSIDEYEQSVAWMVDQAAGRLHVIHHAVFNSLEENIDAARRAEAAGAELVLLGYPPYFHPNSLDDIYDYTKAVCDATNLAVMLFPIPSWGFSRLHPADLPVPLLRRLVDDCPNIAAIKAEGGNPNIMGLIEVHRAFHREVVISCPMEHEYIPLAQLIPIPYCGTNYGANFGDVLPRVYSMIQEGKFDEATAMFHQLDPARKAFLQRSQLLERQHQPNDVEGRGLADGLQRRPDPPPNQPRLRPRHRHTAARPGPGRTHPDRRSRRVVLRRPAPELTGTATPPESPITKGDR